MIFECGRKGLSGLLICFTLWLTDDEIREWRRGTGGRRRVFAALDVALLIALFVAIFTVGSLKLRFYGTAYFVMDAARFLLRLPDRGTRMRATLRTGGQIRLTPDAYAVVDSRGSAEAYPWRLATRVKETRLLWLFRFREGGWRVVPKSRLTDAERRELSAFVQGTALPAARVAVR